MINSAFQHSYSGRIPSLAGINHKRGKSGQNEGLFKTTLEEIEDGPGYNEVLNHDEEQAMNAQNETVNQTAFIEESKHFEG